MAHLGINSSEYERSEPKASLLPAGVYTMTAVRVTQKETNDKEGVYVEVEFDISSPQQYSNRKFWDRFNIINKSAKAQSIGREGISDLAKAAGIVGIIEDDQDLLGKTVQGKIIVRPSDNPKHPEPKNECRKYYPLGVDVSAAGSKPAAAPVAKAGWGTPVATGAGTPATVAAASDTPPWGRK